MIKSLITITLTSTLLLSGAPLASAYDPSTLSSVPCTEEDGSIGTNEDGSTIYEDCFWDSEVRGNKSGQSFYVVNGESMSVDDYMIMIDTSDTDPIDIDSEDHTDWDMLTLTDTDPIDIDSEDHSVAPVAAAPAPAAAPAVTVAPVAPAAVSVAPVTDSLDSHAEEAWALFDAYGAQLLPSDSETRVTFVGHSLSAYSLSADTITVWDTEGNHYLFAY